MKERQDQAFQYQTQKKNALLSLRIRRTPNTDCKQKARNRESERRWRKYEDLKKSGHESRNPSRS